jgi:feruloyl esterase
MKHVSVLILTLAASAAAQTSTKCSDLTKLKLPGVNLAITKAEAIPASASGASTNVPAHCQADGVIDQRTGAGGKSYGIGFAIALPDSWNNRFLMQGGGGFNGTVRPPLGAAAAGDDPALKRGFAVVSTDTGHQGSDQSFFQDQQGGTRFCLRRGGQSRSAGEADCCPLLWTTSQVFVLRGLLDRRARGDDDDAALSGLL